jgi:hypothetical protein
MNDKLLTIQQKLKAPKGQFNSFGKYNYRNCEDILEAVKPLAHELGCTVRLSDTLVQIGERYYIKAVAGLYGAKNEAIEVTAYAREEESKKGMDSSQVTGASSSYARKYALNGLFAIDDAKDSDSTNDGKESKAPELPWLNPGTDQWQKAVTALKGQYKMADIKKKYRLSKENEEKLQNDSLA